MKAVFEKVKVSEEVGIYGFLFEKASFDMPLHIHPEYELTMVLESTGIRYVGNNISDFMVHDLILVGSNLPHCWTNTDDHCGRSSSIVIQWTQDVIHPLPGFDRIRKLLSDSQRGLFIQDQKKVIKDMMLKITEETGVSQYLKLIELLDFLATKTRYKLVAGPSYSFEANPTNTNRLEQVQAYVKVHFKDRIKLAEVAEQLSMNEQAFSRFFSKSMNKPFFSYLNEYRVNIASRLIIESDLQMSEVAYRCGYDSLPFFYKQFKKYKNYSPLEFRKMYSISRAL
ncbi:MAG: AraC family transcriptional regulator [Bacteroidota bacterium]